VSLHRKCGAAAAAVFTLLAAGALAGGADAGNYETHKLQWGAAERSYLLHVPPAKPGTANLPLVIALHGAGGDARSFADETRMEAAADERGMMAAFPDGTGVDAHRTFNAQICCGDAVARQIDDIGFIGAVIDDVARQYPLDRGRVYATGMSNGGMLTYQLAAVHPEWFAAIAPVSATIGGMTRSGQTYVIPVPSQPVPVMIIHGMRDPLVLYEGGASPILKFPNHWKMSVADSLSFWAAASRCTGPPDVAEAIPGKLQSTIYSGCGENGVVRLWAIEDGEHGWPNDVFPGTDGPRSAAAEILAFFAGFQRSELAGGNTK
jgi:polyhydroxybutyrate depolymerase